MRSSLNKTVSSRINVGYFAIIMETKEKSPHQEKKNTNTGSSSSEEEFEVISDDDKILKDNFQELKNDVGKLVQEKVEITKEKEELAQKLRIREQISSEFQQQVEWFLELHVAFTRGRETLPVIPAGLSEENRKQLISIQERMSQALQPLRKSENEREKTKVDEKSEVKEEVIEMPNLKLETDDGLAIRSELNFYRELSQILTSDLNGHQRRDSKFPEVPSALPHDIQIDLQKYKTTIKHILVQKQNPSTKFVEESILVGDSIATSFTNIDLETTDTKDKQEVESQHTQTDHTNTELGKISAENQNLILTNEKQIKVIEEKEKLIGGLENKLKIITVEKETMLGELEKKLQLITAEKDKMIEELENKLKIITAEKETMLGELEKQLQLITAEKDKMIEELENKLKMITAEKETMIGKLENQLKEKEKVIGELESQLKITTAEKEKALLRLSKIAGTKLTEDNPAISDLSDEYRPLNVAEMFGQLYDNEWTDALNVQISDMERSEEDAIQSLLEILQQIYILCQIGTAEHQSKLYDAISMRNGNEKSEAHGQIPSKQDQKKVKEIQKTMATSYFSQLEQNILTSEGFKGPLRREAQLCLPYIRKCIHLCWMIHIQDPPMELVFEFYPGQEIDGKQLKCYRKSGSKIHYLTWPLLLLHHDGPVAQKGIVQPY